MIESTERFVDSGQPDYVHENGTSHGHLAETGDDWGYWYHRHDGGQEPHEHDEE